jgi:hypothetical protein
MSAAASVPLGPWVRGFQNVFDAAKTPEGCLSAAVNVLIGPDGVVTPRAGFDLVTTGGHSVFRHQGRTYGVFNQTIVEFLPTSALALMPGITSKVNWTVVNDEPVFFNNEILGRITPTGAKRIGVEEPGGFAGIGSGKYAAAVSYVSVDGEEGPLSEIVSAEDSVFLPSPTEATVAFIRVYATKTLPDMSSGATTTGVSGHVLREVAQVPASAGGSSHALDSSVFGRTPTTQYRSRMPGGSYARYWRGRLLVARGRVLYVSDPMRYGLYDSVAGRVPFPARIDFIEAVEGGVYVALKDMGVYFLDGESPEKWELKVAATIPAQANSSLLVPTAQMKLEIQFKPEWVAVWFTSKGFAVGLPNGSVTYPQADLLSGLPLGTGSLHFEGDRLIALSQ